MKKVSQKLPLAMLRQEFLRVWEHPLHSIALKDIAQSLELTFEETQKVVEKLVAKGFLKQHFKDAAPPNSPRARYHTQPQMREIIDKLIIKNREWIKQYKK